MSRSENSASVPASALSSSFRDPSGYVFRVGGIVYRRVNARGLPAYRQLMDSGLYAELTADRLLIPHEEVETLEGTTATEEPEASLTLRPTEIAFISYPYEWCFSQLKDAALTTLAVQKRAIAKGMWLKDASAYNIQFHEGKPVLIDTLSLEPLREGAPWPAYKQFCQHFLAPLALMALVAVDLGQLLRVNLDGIPLAMASTLLPGSTKLKPGLLTHIHLHAAAQRHFADGQSAKGQSAKGETSPQKMTRNALLGIIDSLEGTVSGLRYQPKGTVWGDYYANTNYSAASLSQKGQIVAELLESIEPRPATVWDLGANNGEFSRIATRAGISTVAWDIDPAAVEQNYRQCRESRDAGDARLLPLLQDLTNPSPCLGWAEAERDGLTERGPADALFALALIHHLAITNNVPLGEIARYFASLTGHSGHLIVEWVPDSDSQAQRLLRQHDGPVYGYTQEAFESAFGKHFTRLDSRPIPDTERTLYLMRRAPG